MEGRWRAGRFWPYLPVEAIVDDAKLKALKADPVLIVHEPGERNEEVPSVNEVQPGPTEPEPPVPFESPNQRRLQDELLALDAKAEASREADRKAAEPNLAEGSDPRAQQHQNPNKKRR